MSYAHGIYIVEKSSNIAPISSTGSGVVVCIGTAPIHKATEPTSLNRPVLCYNMVEFTKYLGWDNDFENFTLCETAYAMFNSYSVAPAVFINVLDLNKHYNAVEAEFGGVIENAVTIPSAQIDLASIVVTSGEKIEPTKLIKDTDYSLTSTTEDDVTTVTLRILNSDKIEGDKVKIYYKTSADGETAERVVNNVTSGAVNLASDTILSSVTIESGGVDTLRTLPPEHYSAEYVDDDVVLTILDDAQILDDKIKVSYHEVAPDKVTVNDIIGTVDSFGKATGIELVDSVTPMFTTNDGTNVVSILAGSIIAPKYSYDERVATALKVKAKGVSGMFPAIAIIDLDTSKSTNYQDAAQLKIKNGISDANTIVCWPKVKLSDRIFHMSSHVAALMQSVDADNNEVPFVSPSNHSMQIGGTCLADGTEVFLTREQANYLNGNGIVSAINLAGFRLWGSVCSSYGASTEPKDTLIPVRRMFNYIHNQLLVSYFGSVDQPLNRRLIDTVLQRSNIWLNGLVARGALLGGRITFDEAENDLASLAMGKVVFGLSICPPSPAVSITYQLEYDLSYMSTLFG